MVSYDIIPYLLHTTSPLSILHSANLHLCHQYTLLPSPPKPCPSISTHLNVICIFHWSPALINAQRCIPSIIDTVMRFLCIARFQAMSTLFHTIPTILSQRYYSFEDYYLHTYLYHHVRRRMLTGSVQQRREQVALYTMSPLPSVSMPYYLITSTCVSLLSLLQPFPHTILTQQHLTIDNCVPTRSAGSLLQLATTYQLPYILEILRVPYPLECF